MNRFPLVILCLLFLAVFASCTKIENAWLLIKADTAYNQGNFPKAIDLYKKIIEANPEGADLHWKLGIAYFSNNEKENVKKEIAQLRRLGKKDMANDLEHLLNK